MSTSTAPLRQRPKALLFDLDDTLWPVGPVIERAEAALHDWLAAHAPAVARRCSIDSLRRDRLTLLERQPHLQADLGALRRAGLLAAFEAAGEEVAKVDAAMAHFLAARNLVTPYADVLPGLQRLHGRVALGTISNGNADLDVIGMAHHFGVSLAAGRFGRAKPDPAIFHAACVALGVAPHEAVYVGDDLLLDVAGAQNAGLRALWLRRDGGADPAAQAIRPDAICASFDEIIGWLDRQGQQ
jgi:HAD superfamily hydrolase (TIGR01549 family)